MSTSDHADLAGHGWDGSWAVCATATGVEGVVPARVVRHDGPAVLVARDDRVEHVALPPGTPGLAVGDWVLVDDDAVRALLPRRTLLCRRDPSTGGTQPIAANLDVLVIVCGLDRPVRPGRIQRFAALAAGAGAEAHVALTKADLVPDVAEPVRTARDAHPGIPVSVVSTTSGMGVASLRDALRDRTVALAGESGAGKSSLLNALAGRELAVTGTVRGGDHKGRHTTTARELHVLDTGIRVIDTPGVREVGLVGDADAVDEVFDDIAALAERCRFSNCGHGSEPGCAVRAAVQAGHLAAERIEAWERLRREAAAAALRADPVERRRAGRRMGRMVREAQRRRGH